VNASTGNIATIVGNGVVGLSGNGGPATAATLGLEAAGKVVTADGTYYVGGGMVVDGRGDLLIADESDRLIRRINGQTPAFVSAASTSFTEGSQNSFTVAATGFPAVTLSESAGDTLPPGIRFDAVTGRIHGTLDPGITGTWTLHFTASNGIGHDATQTFILIVPSPPTISTTPQSLIVHAHQRVTFNASALGTPAPKAQWEVSTDGGVTYKPIRGATSTTLSFIATAAMNGRHYRALFTNGSGQSPTSDAVLTVV
jgi:hypothetical protein